MTVANGHEVIQQSSVHTWVVDESHDDGHGKKLLQIMWGPFPLLYS